MTSEVEPPVLTASVLTGKRILLGVTGSIAAFKAAGWVRELCAESVGVTVVMTGAAERFVSSLTFGALSGNPVYGNMFDEDPDRLMAHINLSREADCILIAPATAQTIARLAHGMADDLLSTVVLAAKIPVVVCPAMNSNMLSHPATQGNINQLQKMGYHVVPPDSGILACGEEGSGRLPQWEHVREILLSLFSPHDLAGKKIVVTAGPTREPLDPARFLSNRSSGKMGYALAKTAARRGAEVVLVSGPVALSEPAGINTIHVTTAAEMREQVLEHARDADIVVKAAAVADFKPKKYREQKIKKSSAEPLIELEQNPDILAELGGTRRPGLLLVGFAAESRNHEQEGLNKLRRKNADLIVVNDILGAATGFDVETNQVILVDRSGSRQLPLLSKVETANRIWDHVLTLPSPPGRSL
ncbi:MAG: bifunctional phosphopantothenoylcysteine decarboxylase/phosphopantothenate--cysteine ligase CoaBC [Desulfobulbaceae bacterium]|nr:bifunctional phosphopantothenoylcysteine decarboxylase/phosphopantothenate--cysteine ligase CoaBC [Desulfobulbaceae bacterium]